MSIPAAGIVGARLIEAAATEIRAVIELVRQTVAKAVGRDWISVEAIYPDKLVINQDGRLMAYPYTLAEDNTVQLGTAYEVVSSHMPVRLTEAIAAAAREGSVFVEAVGDPAGGLWTIRVIRAGESENHNYYSDAVLKGLVRLLEGARVFEKSDEEHIAAGKNGVVPGKSVSRLVGALTNPRFIEGAAADQGEVHADLKLIQPDGDIAVRVREAYARGLSHLFGFSIDADAKSKVVKRSGRRVREATQFTKVHSVDLIVDPGAGGALLRIVEAKHSQQEDADMALRDRMIEAISAHNPKFDTENATDDELAVEYEKALSARVTESRREPPPAVDAATLNAVRMVECRLMARDLIGAAKLPQPAKDKLLQRFTEATKPFEAADVTKAVEDERAYLARFTESGKPVIPFEDIQVEDRSVKIGQMLDNFFAGAEGVHSFKECYIEITGDKRVSGDLRDCDLSRMRESLGDRFIESLNSGSWANVLGDSITRRMIAEYAQLTDLQAWRRIATVVPVNDFRTQERTRIGGYGNLPAVAQGGTYNPLTSPTDEVATYAVTKRGGTEDVTLEMVRNDDVGAIRRIPTELSLSAANTLYEFVFDFIRTNPVIYDSVALFHATHGNLGTTALDATSFAAARLAMSQQVRAGSGKRLAIQPARLLVPFELQELAYNLFVRNQNLDKTFVQSINPEVIPVAYWTDANDWALTADPARCPTIEIGFLDGREDPELFVQDSPTSGSVFTNDKITYKLRHIYSGTPLEFRGMRKHVVA